MLHSANEDWTQDELDEQRDHTRRLLRALDAQSEAERQRSREELDRTLAAADDGDMPVAPPLPTDIVEAVMQRHGVTRERAEELLDAFGA